MAKEFDAIFSVHPPCRGSKKKVLHHAIKEAERIAKMGDLPGRKPKYRICSPCKTLIIGWAHRTLVMMRIDGRIIIGEASLGKSR
jgi:hypothetical protein